MARRNRATMAEIAAAAGVSVPTVSKVVNGRPDVAPATRGRVEELLLEHGYSSPRARTRERVGLIDLVFVDLGSPWAMEILAGVEEVAYRAGTGVVVSAVHGRHRTRPDERWLENLSPPAAPTACCSCSPSCPRASRPTSTRSASPW